MKRINQMLLWGSMVLLSCTMIFATCRYSMRDVSPLPPEIKTFSIQQFENRARYVNPQLAPDLTEAVRQKVIGLTKLRQVTNDMGDYDLSGYVSDYSVSTSGVQNQQASSNRLNVSFHIILKNTQDASKNFEADVSSSYDFSSSLSLQQAERELMDRVLKNVSEAVFNRIFSNW
ncbi:MAG: hypothetical protein H3C36_12715 [Chitinophagaceae bacterium]|nr:hypothetical protein [Chitinophagaceae bacterium]MCW5913856.1 hypothetical protein [Chitinophagaceae bacterium]MCZ2398033.1 LPS assembly lipoprotein LptE [Chitinophagales bacterium]